GGPRKMLRMNTSATGDFYLSLTGPSPVRGSVIGKISNNTISASTKDLYVDLATVWRLLPPQRDLIFAGGFAEAELEISGSLSDPEFFGTIQGNSVCIQVPHYVARDIRPVPFTAVVDGNEIRLDPTPVSVGLGAGTASGWFRFDRWIPNIFKLDINVPPQTPIPFGFDITGFMANGYTSGDLTLAMENLVFSVSGDLYANNTEIWLNTDEVTKAQQNMDLYTGNAAPVVVNLNVKTGPTVEFLWPNANIPILRLNPDMGTNVKITADSQTRQFTLNSDVKIRSGEIYYFERSFYIRSGTLTFRENELRFNPLLTVRAEARDRNDDGPVIITMFVDNAPLLSFTARFESQPSLSQNEIFALLGQNLTGSQVDEATGNIQRAFLGSSADLLAQFVVVRQAEREIRRITRLDMFSIRTQLLQNFVFSATGIKQTPVDRSAGVGNYFDNTTVFLGKYIGTDMFAQAMLALRYDEYRTTYGGLKFEWDIGIELQSPIVNIRWDFVPSHPENWWVDDNSITITYSKTF
ncbi:MAG: translocation/assembly module TamB, partial [Treponema sp.]|nr:translocation/assembly module TamB [Treponema sp.]